jgi:hypothetical protein
MRSSFFVRDTGVEAGAGVALSAASTEVVVLFAEGAPGWVVLLSAMFRVYMNVDNVELEPDWKLSELLFAGVNFLRNLGVRNPG